MSSVMDGPVWLVQVSTDGAVRVNPAALGTLDAISPPLQVISIFGPRQTGKSHLLNCLAGRTGFTVSNDTSPKDPGIKMWCLPNPLDKKQTLILLDTEGFEEDWAVGEACCPIFILSVLLSSVFLYNTQGPITCEVLNKLLHVVALPNQVQLPSSDWPSESFLLSGVLPAFMWCVRDVALEMEIDGIELLPNDYLASILNEGRDDDESPTSMIQRLFPSQKLFNFCLTHGSGKDIEKLPHRQLSSCFMDQVEVLKTDLLRSEPKTFMDAAYISGKELRVMLEHFADNLTRNSVIWLNKEKEEIELMAQLSIGEMESPMDWDCFHTEAVVESPSSIPHQSLDPPPRVQDQPRKQPLLVRTSLGPVEMPAPVCLIENTKGNELKVNQEAVDILNATEQPVVVVAIVGLYRTGKSYLMNKLAAKQTGFSLGATIQSHTKGIWMWCVPHPCRDNCTLVLLDTEGLGDVEKGDQKNDSWIFALAVLLSSTLVYNSMGTINNQAVESLHYVTELTETIKVKSSGEVEDASAEFMRFFPSFVWAVRDFHLELFLDGKAISADEYLENSLKLKTGIGPKNALYNAPRECIRKYFPSRKCFVFDQPSSKEKIKKLEELRDDELDPGFVKQTRDFCSHILNHSQIKTINEGFKVTGRLLGNLTLTYVDAIRSGKVPCLESAVSALAQIENSAAVERALSLYRQQMKEKLSLPTETQKELSDVSEQCLQQALQLFMNRSFKDENNEYQRNLMVRVEGEYDLFCNENTALSQDRCTAVLIQLEDQQEEDDYLKPGGYRDYRDNLDNLIQQYKETPGKGTQAACVLEEYLKRKEDLGRNILMADHALTEQDRRIKEEEARVEMEKYKAEVARQQEEMLKQRLEDKDRAYRENEKQLREKMENDRRAALDEHNRILDRKLKEQKALIMEGFQDKASRMESEMKSLRRQVQQQSKGSSGWNCSIS
ncbi:guanylate-binding protein 1 isoform X2 [Amia ocellicauda]|uniref:guanylate-binding protein 1 isoform X2 n=1 Tax=Amia ocellicauda TaxID=2972642 RepID=UPI003463BA4A